MHCCSLALLAQHQAILLSQPVILQLCSIPIVVQLHAHVLLTTKLTVHLGSQEVVHHQPLTLAIAVMAARLRVYVLHLVVPIIQ